MTATTCGAPLPLCFAVAMLAALGGTDHRASAAGPAVAQDVDGDGAADVMVYRPRTGEWWLRKSNGSGPERVSWGGVPGDVPALGDYDGDGVIDLTVFRPSTGIWHIRGTGSVTWGLPSDEIIWGRQGDIPVPLDRERRRTRGDRRLSARHRGLVLQRSRARKRRNGPMG